MGFQGLPLRKWHSGRHNAVLAISFRFQNTNPDNTSLPTGLLSPPVGIFFLSSANFLSVHQTVLLGILSFCSACRAVNQTAGRADTGVISRSMIVYGGLWMPPVAGILRRRRSCRHRGVHRYNRLCFLCCFGCHIDTLRYSRWYRSIFCWLGFCRCFPLRCSLFSSLGFRCISRF